MNDIQLATDQRALRAVAVQFLINGAVVSSYIPRLPEIRDALQVDLAIVGQIITVASLGGLLGSFLTGKVIKALTTRYTMIFGTIGLVLLLPCIALAPSVATVLLVLMAISFLDVMVDVAMNIQGSNLSARRTVPVMNRLHGLWSVGSVMGGALAATMAALFIPLQWHLLGAACLMALGIWYVGGGLLRSDQAHPDEQDDPESPMNKRRARVPTSLWIFAVLGAATYIPEMLSSDWSPFRLSDDLQAGPGLAGMAYVAFTLGMVTGRLSGDSLSAYFGKARLFRYAIITAIIGLSVACLVDIVPLTFIALGIAGVGISVLFPSLYDAAAQDPHRPSLALGIMTAGSRSSMLLAPITVGYLASTPFLTVGMTMALMAIPCLLIIGYLSHRLR